MSKTALVTGGAGFIGSHLCDNLIAQDYTVICVDNFLTSSRDNIAHLESNDRFTFIEHDVTKLLSIDVPIDEVYHFASPASPNSNSPISYHALAMETMMVNTVGTHEILKLAEEKHARFLYASTSEIYGDPLEHPQKETYRGNVSTTGPRSVYDESKRFGETLAAYYQREKNIDTRIIRIFNTYGPRMSTKDMRMSVQFVLQALANEPITIYGDGSQTRSLCYVDDLVSGIMTYMHTDGLAGEIINLGATTEHAVKEYAEMIKSLAISSSEIVETEPLPADDPLQRKPDISKAKELLGWEPKIELEEGLKKTIEYFRQNVQRES